MTDENNNHLDEFEQHELGQEPESEVRRGTGLRANLSHAWRTQPLIKLLALMVIVAAVVGVTLSLFSSSASSDRHSTSSIAPPPELHQPPGGQATERVREETMLANQQREKSALQNGGSSIPTPIGGNSESQQNDPLNELRAQIDNLQKEVSRPKPTPAAVQQQPVQQVQQPEQFDEGLAKAMQKQMSDLVQSWNPKSLKNVVVTKAVIGTSAPNHGGVAGSNGSGSPTDMGSVANAPAKILIPAGTINYAKLLTQANSDVPGPILAEIVSGPLTGARAIGHFSVENSYADYLVLRFNLAELKGKEYQINTLAIDPDTSLGGMATDVDERYFERVFLPAAAAFLQGVGTALSQPSSTTSTTGDTTIVSQSGSGIDQGMYKGLSQAAQTLGQFFQNQANNTKPLIVVAAGTPMGLLFVTSLKDQPDQTTTNGRGISLTANSGLAGYSTSDSSLTGTASSAAYPGMTVAGYGNTASNVAYPPGLNINTGTGNYNPAAYNSFMPGYSSMPATVIAPH